VRIAVLASGRGSNLRALLDSERVGHLGGARVVAVFGDRAQSGALDIARNAGRTALALAPADFASREAFDAALFDHVLATTPDLVVCAGYMRVLSAEAVGRVTGRMINIHPSLLPLYPGLRPHARALAAGDKEHGASVHLVVPEVDAGAVLSQVRIPILPEDDAAALAGRLLAREHPLLVATVRAIAEGQLTLGPGALAWKGNPLHAPLSLTGDDRLEETAG
jgi:phosphoribosylglycinamide formyltransferase-1